MTGRIAAKYSILPQFGYITAEVTPESKIRLLLNTSATEGAISGLYSIQANIIVSDPAFEGGKRILKQKGNFVVLKTAL